MIEKHHLPQKNGISYKKKAWSQSRYLSGGSGTPTQNKRNTFIQNILTNVLLHWHSKGRQHFFIHHGSFWFICKPILQDIFVFSKNITNFTI